VLRIVSGFCFAGIYVVAESWLNDRADSQSRGTLLAVYMVVIYVGLGGGQLLLERADPSGAAPFTLIAVLMCLAVSPIALTAQRAPEFALPRRIGVRDLLDLSPLGTMGVVFSGAVSATLFSLGPVYAAQSGFSNTEIAVFMACSILPAVVLQLPLGRYSDRIDRRTVLIGMALAAAAAAGIAMTLAPGERAALLACIAAYGGLALTTYALCVAHINDRLHPQQMVAASGTIILLNGVGAIAGPILVSAAMSVAGPGAYLGSAIVLQLAFASFATWRKTHRQALPSEEKAPFVGAPPQVAPTGRLTSPPPRGD
jgi:MFS family permease